MHGYILQPEKRPGTAATHCRGRKKCEAKLQNRTELPCRVRENEAAIRAERIGDASPGPMRAW